MTREMTPNDWEDVKRIYTQAMDAGNVTFQMDCPPYEEWDRNHIKECRYVAVIDQQVVGFIVISPTSSRECYRGVASLSIYLDYDHRGMGIGKTLLTKLCAESEKKGYWCLTAGIFSDNEASIRLHKGCGFREVGYREKIAKNLFGEWQDTILMERRSDYR